MNIKNNLILALDVGSEKEAIDICEKVKDNIDTIKIGYPLALAEGLEIIQKLKDKFDFKVICDFKVADIDATNEKICEETFKAGADAIIGGHTHCLQTVEYMDDVPIFYSLGNYWFATTGNMPHPDTHFPAATKNSMPNAKWTSTSSYYP